LESAKECVTTHLPNESALKMDGAEACYLHLTERVKLKHQIKNTLSSRRARGFVKKARPVRVAGTNLCADLGGSSNYSNENFED